MDAAHAQRPLVSGLVWTLIAVHAQRPLAPKLTSCFFESIFSPHGYLDRAHLGLFRPSALAALGIFATVTPSDTRFPSSAFDLLSMSALTSPALSSDTSSITEH